MRLDKKIIESFSDNPNENYREENIYSIYKTEIQIRLRIMDIFEEHLNQYLIVKEIKPEDTSLSRKFNSILSEFISEELDANLVIF